MSNFDAEILEEQMQRFKVFRYVVIIIITTFILFSIIDIRESRFNYRTEKINYYQKEFKGIIKSKSLNRGIRIRLFNNGKIEKIYLGLAEKLR